MKNREEYIRLIIAMLKTAKDSTIIRVYKKLQRESVVLLHQEKDNC